MSQNSSPKTSWKDWLLKRQFPAWIYIIFLIIWAMAVYCYILVRTS